MKIKRIASLLLVPVLLCCACAACAEGLSGVLADFTEQASVVTNADSRSYEHFFFDYDGDGEEELFFLVGYAGDGVWPLGATIYTGADSGSPGWSPPKKLPDAAEIRTVCFIDINPDDGRKDLVISVVASDGAEYTTILQGADENNPDDVFGRQWKDGSDKPIFSGLFRGISEDGVLQIGTTLYAWDEKYWLKEVGTAEVPAAEIPPEATETPAGPTEAPAGPTEAPAEVTPAPAGENRPIRTGVKYTACAFRSQGVEIDPAVMPEYSVVFLDDGTAEFIMAGTQLPVLAWTADGDDFVIEYAGQVLRFVPDGEGFTVDMFGTITARMIPE